MSCKRARQRLLNLFRHNRHRNPPPKDEQEDETEKEPEPEPPKTPEVEIIPEPPAEGKMPGYFHVGTSAKECLTNGYKIGTWRLLCTSKARGDYNLSTFGEGYPTVNNVFGGLEVFKELEDKYSVSFGWLTTHKYLTELGVRGQNLEGDWYAFLKSTLGTADKVEFQTKIKCGFERNPVKVELVVPIYKEPLLMGYIMLAPVENFLLGYRLVYNLEEKGFDMHAMCLGYYSDRTEVGLKLENFQNLRTSLFQRIGERWAVALKADLCGSDDTRQCAIGCQYDFQNGILLKGKVRSDSLVSMVYQSKLSENMKVLYHMAFEAADTINGSHKIGLSWEFNC